jgi:hypothetical protein
MPSFRHNEEIGAKLGPKLVRLVSDAIVSTKVKLLDTEHRARVASGQTLIDRAGHEVADLYRPLVQKMIADLDLPDEIRSHIEKSISGHHQWQALAGLAIGSSGVGSSFSQVLSNYLAVGVRGLIDANPQLVPSNETMAALGAKGTWPMASVHYFSRGQGYSDDIITAEVEAARAYPDLTTTIELLRRGIISRSLAGKFLERNAIPPELHNDVLRLQRVLPTPADLADMVVRGIKTEGDASHVAAESGVNAADFADLVLDTGEPLALQELLEAYRRGFIDRSRLERGIRQGRTRNEWIDVAEKLRYTPMSVADAVNAVVQNHLSMAAGEAKANENGLLPGEFATLYQTAGEPLSRTEMEELYNRGLVSKSEVDQALSESRLKNKYIPAAFELHRKLVPPRTLHQFVTAGTMTHEQALKEALWFGYSLEDAKAFVGSGSVTKVDPHRNSVVSSITALYEENAITQAHASGLIARLKFDKTEADFIIQAAELRRQARAIGSAITAIRSKYLAHHITESEASGKLDGIGIPAERRDYLLHLWKIEQSANVRVLTPAQIHTAFKKGLITPEDALARLIADGYSQGDATLILEGA